MKDKLQELQEQITSLEDEIKVGDSLNDSLMKVMYAIPECSVHGNTCVPHAVEWVEKQKIAGMENNPLKYLRQNIRLWGISNGLATLLECTGNVEPTWLGEEMYRIIVGMQDSLKDLPMLADLRGKPEGITSDPAR